MPMQPPGERHQSYRQLVLVLTLQAQTHPKRLMNQRRTVRNKGGRPGEVQPCGGAGCASSDCCSCCASWNQMVGLPLAPHLAPAPHSTSNNSCCSNNMARTSLKAGPQHIAARRKLAAQSAAHIASVLLCCKDTCIRAWKQCITK